MSEPSIRLEPKDALIVVDVQNDFLPGGSLAVPQGEEVVPVLNRYLAAFAARDLPVIATRDWHPSGHCSFQAQGGPWPVHCVQHSPGAQFAPGLRLPDATTVISKGARPDRDAYSSFEGTELSRCLRDAGVTRLFIGGLATDYCVLHTVKDACAQRYTVYLLEDAIRAVNVKPDDGGRARDEMVRLGAVLIRSERLAA